MKGWKALIEYNGVTIELRIEARSYSEACLAVERMYPGCIVKSISEIHS